jgi:hypothetical protein
MGGATKRVWSAPELVVLGRGRPQEAVLIICRSWNPSTGPDSVFNSCYSITNPCSPACNSQVGS